MTRFLLGVLTGAAGMSFGTLFLAGALVTSVVQPPELSLPTVTVPAPTGIPTGQDSSIGQRAINAPSAALTAYEGWLRLVDVEETDEAAE